MEKFYNGEKIMSLENNFKFIVGNRSAGKTFYFKKYCVDNFIKNKRKFIFMRRYITEIDIIKDNFFHDLEQFYNNKYDIKVYGNDIHVNNEHCGKFISLSSVSKYKSINMSDYDVIVFDEFIPEDNKYLNQNKNYFFEVESCLNLFQTVARGIGKSYREEVKFIFISNTISTSNPYFNYFKIDKLVWNGTKKYFKDKFFAFEIINIDNSVKDSNFGEFIKNTSYGRYAMSNDFYLDKNFMIYDKIPKDSRALFSIEFNSNKFTVHQKGKFLYVSDTFVNTTRVYSLSNDGEYPFLRGTIYYNTLRKLIYENKVYFKNVTLKTVLTEY